MEMIKVRRAMISVADKSGVAEFAAALAERGIAIVSTGGTAQVLRAAGLQVEDAAARTGFAQALSGRVKTLHPALLGGILADRDNPDHAAEAENLNAEFIDLVVVNFYRFADAVAAGADRAELIEKIDIGGPTMVRAAAKNHRHVAVVVDPEDYRPVLEQLAGNDGALSRPFVAGLAAKAFARTSDYDRMIAAALGGDEQFPPAQLSVSLRRIAKLRYGENPHQQAAMYAADGGGFKLLAGGEVSYNNVQDAIAAWRSVSEFEQASCSIIKHATPCGIASGDSVAAAVAGALAANPESAFGGVVAINRRLDEQAAATLAGRFIEVLVVPQADEQALAALAGKKRLRIVQAPLAAAADFDLRVSGGLALAQTCDRKSLDAAGLRELAGGEIEAGHLEALLFAWRACKCAKSNAIVLARAGATIGIGSGQTSRVEAARQAIEQARQHCGGAAGAVAASDGFFPFADGVEILAAAGVVALIQPGGSRRDGEVEQAAREAGVAMVMTGVRHFIH